MSRAEALIVERWEHLLREAYLFARGERLAQLRGRYVKSYDDRGLHIYSTIWGEILACEALVPEIAAVMQMGQCTPDSLRREAHRDATKTFVHEYLTEEEPGELERAG